MRLTKLGFVSTELNSGVETTPVGRTTPRKLSVREGEGEDVTSANTMVLY